MEWSPAPMVVIAVLTTWIDLLLSLAPWILLLSEIYLAKRVYGTTRRRTLLHQKMAQLRLHAGALNQSRSGTRTSDPTGQHLPNTPSENPTLLLMLREQLPIISSVAWERLATAAVLASVFVLTYGGVGILLRPFANGARLNILPLCLPLAIVPLPYLLRMRPHTTLTLLVAALALTFLALILTRM
jgi:hypothetical protein